MIVVASIWEQGWNTPIKEYDLWHYPLLEFNVDEFAVTPVSGILKNDVKEFHSVDELVQHYGLPVILCSENGSNTLEDFVHPENALYLFNRTSGGGLEYLQDQSLKVETNSNQGNLWGHQAASIILYDRYLKNK